MPEMSVYNHNFNGLWSGPIERFPKYQFRIFKLTFCLWRIITELWELPVIFIGKLRQRFKYN